MKAILLPIALALSGCGADTTPVAKLPAPAEVANATTLDEQTALAIELAYQAAAQTMLVTGAAKIPAVKAADQRAYTAVKAVRAAYDAGNASSYLTATVDARAAVASLLTAIKG
jgi:hypothetical protein